MQDYISIISASISFLTSISAPNDCKYDLFMLKFLSELNQRRKFAAMKSF